MKKILLISIVVFPVLFLMAGCSKKDKDYDKKEKSAVTQQPEKKVDISLQKQKLDNEIYLSFPVVKDYLYAKSSLFSQEKFLNENQTSIHTMTSAICVFETSESLETVYGFYKNIFPEDKFRINYKDKKIRTFFCSQFITGGLNGLAYMISVKSYRPSMNFNADVIDSQIEVIKGQIAQYEKIKIIHENRLRQNITVKKTYKALQECLKRIKELKIQASALSNRTTVIELSLNYIMPSVPQPVIKDND